MLDSFLLNLRIRLAYSINGFFKGLKSLPIIKKLIPADIYAKNWIKTLGLVYFVIKEFLGFFIGKMVYFAVFFAIPYFIGTEEGDPATPPLAIIFHIFLFLTLIGTLLKNTLFEAQKEMYYAVILMRMDAKRYAVSNYTYALLRHFIGFFVVIGLARLIIFPEMNPLWVILLPTFVVGAKITVSYLQLLYFRKHGYLIDGAEPKTQKIVWPLIIGLLLAAYLPPIFGYPVPEKVTMAVCVLFIASGVICAFPLFKANDYRPILKYSAAKLSFETGENIEANLNSEVKKSYMQKISEDDLQSIDESVKGYRFFNKTFVRRHRRMLLKSIFIITGILLAGLAVAVTVCIFGNEEIVSGINGNLMSFTPTLLFVMYMINRGQTITQIMFFNCDSSMLGYNSYRRPDVVLGLFKERLKTLTLINLLPAGVLAVGFPLLLFLSGGTDNKLNYLILFVEIIAMSVFFSVHYLTMYYLFQPFTQGLVNKSPAYRIIMALTYVVCYAGMQLSMRTLISGPFFTAVVVGFTLIYIPVALYLAYRHAPKTFRLKH